MDQIAWIFFWGGLALAILTFLMICDLFEDGDDE